MYYAYDMETNRWDWFPSAIEDANLFATVEDAKEFLPYAKKDSHNGYIISVWIEKLSSIPVPGTAEST